ncbi:MAG: RNA 2',3'-cyclic phosphodiesterase [Phycisphaerae bacterium]|nr:RNA 2',3'-cyclic phosphodiesterase [Phycisphaerae bacterium]
MRLFVAIDIEPHVRIRIRQIQNRLAQTLDLSDKQVKWVHPEQIHLTLKFLGDVKDALLTQVCDIVKRTAAEFESFDVEVKGLGVFGQPARIVWAGTSACPPMAQLQAELENRFSELGWDPENRPFTGHLTLCRVKNASAGRKLADAIEPYKNEPLGLVGVTEVVLYQSQLTSAGPLYTAVCRAALK